ncbi:hypothetical protein [Vreelandella massiliensis]|uniref:hypothetical protein n=1 Tax=Vreelandella massiliensis TaxID=1816686 RepID=UPI00096A34BE|nr:hypothetical protein [Halomonas massiliensis]
MPISRASATKLKRDHLPYTTVPNATIDRIGNPDALAIWVHLQTKPTGWTVRPTELRKRFSLGRNRFSNAMNELKALGLITQEPLRGESGQLAGTVLHVHYKVDDELDDDYPLASEDETVPRMPADDAKAQNPASAQTDHAAHQEEDLLGVVPTENQRLEEAFEVFYNAGLPKKKRKYAQKAFERAAKRQPDPMPFAEMLAANIQTRLLAGEVGFAQLHPSTYLNQERWLDEINEDGALSSLHGCPDKALYDLFGEVMREQNLPQKAPTQGFDIFRGSRAHQDMLARWDKLFNTRNPKGRVRYDDTESGLRFWRYAFEVVAKKQNFRQSDVTISNFFHPDVFHRAIEGTLRQHGAAR